MGLTLHIAAVVATTGTALHQSLYHEKEILFRPLNHMQVIMCAVVQKCHKLMQNTKPMMLNCLVKRSPGFHETKVGYLKNDNN